MSEIEITKVEPALERIRADLVAAVASEIASRPARRPRTRLRFAAVAAVVAAGTVGTAIAAVNGAFSPAPPEVQRQFANVKGVDVDVSHAVRIGVIDDHPAYAAPTADGGYCLYFAPSPGRVQRSGPSGGTCTVVGEVGEGEIALAPQFGHDGGFVFGRVGSADAASVEVTLPGRTAPLTAPVVADRFFLARLSPSAVRPLTTGETVSATAKNAGGDTVARTTRATEESVAPVEVPTTTVPEP